MLDGGDLSHAADYEARELGQKGHDARPHGFFLTADLNILSLLVLFLVELWEVFHVRIVNFIRSSSSFSRLGWI